MKKLCTILTAVLVLGLAVSAFANQFTNNLADLIADKNSNLSGGVNNPPETAVAGDDIASATVIGGLPYADASTTAGFTNNYDAVCPYTGSTSPDVVYRYSPTSNQQVSFDLCGSGYDTKIYVYENAAGNTIACNDDACLNTLGVPYASIVSCVSLTAGNTYYIIVDGYGGDFGTYTFSAYVSASCPGPCDPTNCPAGARLEGEPVCATNYLDTFNGGCNSNPEIYSLINCNDTVCGAGGNYVYNGLSYRDTDWYQFNLPVAGNVTTILCASFESLLYSLELNSGCGLIGVTCGPTFGTAGSTSSCTYAANAGLNWVFVATSAFSGVPCGSPYILTVDCGGTVNATESKSWGGIKGLYR